MFSWMLVDYGTSCCILLLPSQQTSFAREQLSSLHTLMTGLKVPWKAGLRWRMGKNNHNKHTELCGSCSFNLIWAMSDRTWEKKKRDMRHASLDAPQIGWEKRPVRKTDTGRSLVESTEWKQHWKFTASFNAHRESSGGAKEKCENAVQIWKTLENKQRY